jgi:hypothetical protein
LKQNRISVEIQESLLTISKSSDNNDPRRVDSHTLKRRAMSYRGDDQGPIILKANEAAIKQMINAWSQKQTVLTVKPLLVCRVSPWLTVTCDQMDRVFDTSDATS